MGDCCMSKDTHKQLLIIEDDKAIARFFANGADS